MSCRIAEILRELYEKEDLTAEEIAKKLGSKRSIIYNRLMELKRRGRIQKEIIFDKNSRPPRREARWKIKPKYEDWALAKIRRDLGNG